MAYDIEIIRKIQNKTSKWTGGTTTELYIYPRGSSYADRNFKWRLSSARVNVEESTFTSLPGVSRVIMVIEGELLLKHEGHHTARLKAFEKDRFNGEWITTSFGKVIDFNLMMSQGCNGRLEAISIYKGESKNILLHNNVDKVEKLSQVMEAFYIVKGVVEIVTETKEKVNLNEGDLALITRTEEQTTSELKIHNVCQQEAKIIKTSIFY